MFPHVVQPLRIFEPRYVEMFEDALASDQLITMALLETGWELEFEGQPVISPVCCLGRILSHGRQDDGSYNCLLAGLKRVLVIRELNANTPYRSAEVELVEDSYQAITPSDDLRLQESIISSFRDLSPGGGVTQHSLQKLLKNHLSLGMLSDVVAYSAPLPIDQKQQLLEDFDVKNRAETLVEYLQQLLTGDLESYITFPPEFSDN